MIVWFRGIRVKIDRIVKTVPGERVFENTMLEYESTMADFGDQVTP